MNSDTLLEKAKKIKSKSTGERTEEECQLAIAWLKNEIRTLQVGQAKDISKGNTIYWLAITLKAAFAKGFIFEKTSK